MSTTPAINVIPGLRYADAPAAIEWLCSVLGFEKHAVHAGPDGSIAHAELTFGGGMVMLGSSAHSTPLDESGHANAPSIYLIAADTDSVYARAKGAGAKMVLDIEDKDYGGRGFSCRDPEGYVWSVGSYDPMAQP